MDEPHDLSQTARRKRIAFVVQRYGLEVCGGAELHCRWVAEHLAKYCDVEVLTTCAVEHLPWDNHYPPGETDINGVLVRRFRLDFVRKHHPFDALSRRVFGEAHSYLDEVEWVKMLGPHSTDLLKHLARSRLDYDLVIFFTYQYFPTVFGLPLIPERAALVPTAHDDPTINLDVYNSVFHLPRLIIYNTETERSMVEWRFKNHQVPGHRRRHGHRRAGGAAGPRGLPTPPRHRRTLHSVDRSDRAVEGVRRAVRPLRALQGLRAGWRPQDGAARQG